MSTIQGGPLQRPYTQGTFQSRLDEFEDLIKEITLQDVEATPEERRQMITENLRFDQFCDSIRALFGADIHAQDLKAVYRKISTNPDAKVDWSELFGYFQSEYDGDDLAVGEDVSVFTVSARRRVGEAAGDRKRRDIVQSITYISSLDCYLTASQKGALSVWSSKLRLQACTDINESAWVTGCDYLPGLRRVVTCTERSLTIWDNRAKGKNQQVFCIKPIEHSPQCMTWIPWSNSPNEDSLIFGDDQGYVNLLTLCGKDLTVKNNKGAKSYSQNYNIDPNKLAIPMRRRKLHDDWVLKVKYFPDLRCFASCSPSSTASFVLEELNRIGDEGDVRGVGIPKGVNAFDYCSRANIIATGGVDKVIRVWHPHIFSRPTGKLIGHLFTIVDIACNEKDQHIISLSTARVFRIWDIHTLTSLQVFTDNEERPGERRIYSMFFDNKHDRLITGSSVIDAWPLTRAVQDTMQVPHTHDRPLNQVLYNKELHQVITVCTESVVKVWETETGKLVYQITEAHGANVEITAIGLDKTGYRLVTGAVDGSIKVWDFGSGQDIKWREGRGTDDDHSVLGLQYCDVDGQRCIAALGWNNCLYLYLDSNDNHDIALLREFQDIHYLTKEVSISPAESSADGFNKDKQPLPDIGYARSASSTTVYKKDKIRHLSLVKGTREYVLTTNELTCTTAMMSNNLLATGCANGNVVLWDITKSLVEKVFYLPKLDEDEISEAKTRSRSKHDHSKAVNGIKFLVRKTRKLDPAFLTNLTGNLAPDDEEEDGANNTPPEGGRVTSKRASAVTSRLSRRSNKINTPARASKEPTNITNNDENNPNEISQNQENNGIKTTAAEEGGENTEKDEDEREKTMEKEEEPEEEDDFDPNGKMIVTTYDPIIVTCHQDSFIRFWNMQGDLLREITAMTRRQGSAVTAVCHDEDCNIVVTGDHKGYLTLWDVSKFLEKPESENTALIKQIICWRAHLTKIIQLTYVDSLKAIISGSSDESVRIWWGKKGRFVGFYGQHRPLIFPSSEETASTPVLPYDITEGPLAPVKTISARQKVRNQQKYEYPLVFDNARWAPFRRSAYMTNRSIKLEPEDKKFFTALIKPRPDKNHLESFKSGEFMSGAVFRSLPVYRVSTPERLKTPETSIPRNNNPFFTQTVNQVKRRASIHGRRASIQSTIPFRTRRGSVSSRRPSISMMNKMVKLGQIPGDKNKPGKKLSKGFPGVSAPANSYVGSPRRR